MDVYELSYFEEDAGNAPFVKWLENLADRRGAAIIRTRLDRLRLGLFGDSKYLMNGVFELRISFGPGYRIYYTQKGKNIIVLLCGGDKSSQKKDIMKAINYTLSLQEPHDA